ncbi:RNA methyltransferase [Burkholderia glumae]|uniref:RNA methyltransferase n=1 Tax=Burkholderia glumae TaxID=337 RepID=UPI002150E3FC|nr:RNA methyltransferase [Burkholderia glumae]
MTERSIDLSDCRGRRRGFAAIGLHQPKDPKNVGSILRAAGCYGAAMVAVSGQRYMRAATDTQKAYRHLPVLRADDLTTVIPFGAVPVAVEFIPGAPPLPTYRHPESAFYIFGPEDGSVPTDLVARCRDVVFVPTAFCMNLAAAVNVVLYDRMAKQMHRPTHDRETNR